MKRIIVIILTCLMIFTLCSCGETCDHLNTTVSYSEGSLLSIKKTVVCNDCGEEVETLSLSSIAYVYDKVILEDGDVKLTLKELQVDGWNMPKITFEFVGTGSSKRIFNATAIYLDNVDIDGWLYADNLHDNKASEEELNLMGDIDYIEILSNPKHSIEIEYEITKDIDEWYEKVSSGTISFSLEEYTTINEVEE